jgi:AcrR family transcriptional regulator
MSPRPYKLGQRQVATNETRKRIVSAARETLASDESGPGGFTVDAVARRAGVARMTVYYQFQSKRGLLEALFDDLANRGLMPHLAPVFKEPSPTRALDGLINAFAEFWNSDRIVLRRARALAALDPEVAESVRARDELRRGHLQRILGQIRKGQPLGSAVDVLHMLTSFETFDALLSGERTFEEATKILRGLAAAVLGSARPRPKRRRPPAVARSRGAGGPG